MSLTHIHRLKRLTDYLTQLRYINNGKDYSTQPLKGGYHMYLITKELNDITPHFLSHN